MNEAGAGRQEAGGGRRGIAVFARQICDGRRGLFFLIFPAKIGVERRINGKRARIF